MASYKKPNYSNGLKQRFQSKVNMQLKYFGRIGGGLYDELDDNGFYLDRNNKVKEKARAYEPKRGRGNGGSSKNTRF